MLEPEKIAFDKYITLNFYLKIIMLPNQLNGMLLFRFTRFDVKVPARFPDVVSTQRFIINIL